LNFKFLSTFNQSSITGSEKSCFFRGRYLYDEIRPVVEEHERDNEDIVSTNFAEKWIEASCCKYKADFDLYAAIIKIIATTPLRLKEDARTLENKMELST
jgi:hypothetical protein